MKIAIHQPQYMPWVGYMHKMASVELFVYLDDVQFKKNEWQHRNRVRGPSGTVWLSVPTRYRFPQTIREVMSSSTEPWRRAHRRTLDMCYGRAPFYDHYADRIGAFLDRAPDSICDVAAGSAELLRTFLGITTPTVFSSATPVEGASTERLVNLCHSLGATTYLAGAGGHDYMDLSLFEHAGIAVEFQQFSLPRYPQKWARTPEEFIPGLSALDLLFNCGDEAYAILMGGVS